MSASHWTERPQVLHLRRRSAVANAAASAIVGFRRHRTGKNAALIAHYGFLSVFPLMLVFTTVLGLVLQGHPTLQADIIDSVFSRLPIIGQQIATDPAQLSGNWVVLVVGLLTALWAALRAFNVLQWALDDVAEVEIDHRPNLLVTRARSLLGLVIIGGGQLFAATLTVFVGASGVLWANRLLLGLATLAVNTASLAGTYRYLCSAPQSWRRIVPGAVVGGLAFTVLQVVGSTLVARLIANASPVYGTFASVIGLITWMSLHAVLALLGAELNRVLPPVTYSG